LLSVSSKATHIVGGDFYYDYLGNNLYKITLKLYIDCINGNDQAILSDREAIIGVFDAGTNDYERSFVISRSLPTRLDKLHYECVRPPRDVCVDGYTYTQTVKLDPGDNGKILSFQRCCRNNSITNIYYPESTGSTYWIKIPPLSHAGINSAARFKELPPNYLCTDAPLVFDHSATDPDGDSLVYELYQPYLGATRSEPRPDHTLISGMFREPPFIQVQWKTPYYTYNQMGGSPRLRIDRKTGELTVTPSTVGQFVIGVKVKEYRKGVFVGETFRDYQFNVRHCTFDIVSAFASPVFSCSDTVDFANKSKKAVNYRWDFGDPTTSADTSHEVNPTYIYPGNGDYRVRLRAWNDICEDEFITTVRIRSEIVVDLGPDLIFCDGVDRILDTRAYDATRVDWSNGQNGRAIRVKDTGTYVAVVYYDNCVDSGRVHISTDPVNFSIPPDSLFCDKVDCILDAGIEDVHYQWSTSPRDTFRRLYVQDTGVYWVRVNNKNCVKFDTTRIYTANKPEIGPYYFVCNEFNKTLDAGGRAGSTYLWDNGNTSRYRTIDKKGTYFVRITEGHCVLSDTLIVENPRIDLELGPDEHFCDYVLKMLEAPAGMKKYTWNYEGNTNTIQVKKAGQYFIEVEDSNGCTASDTINLTVSQSPEITLGPDTSICSRTSLKISPGGNFLRYTWSFGVDDDAVEREIESAGTYSVEVEDSFGCIGRASINVRVDPEALPNDLYVPNAFTPNGDGLNEVFPFSFIIKQPEFRARVFNRWGQKVYDSETHGPTWDAHYQNEIVHPEAFLYLVEYRGCDGNFRRLKGTVTVMR